MGQDGFLDEAWALLRDPEAMLALYKRAAKKDPELALAFARYRHSSGSDGEMARRALVEEGGVRWVAPLVTAQLFGKAMRWSLGMLQVLGDARSVGPIRDAMKKAEADLKPALWAAIATWGSDDDRAEAAKHLKADAPVLARALARHGHAGGRAQLVAHLAEWLDEWPNVRHVGSSEFEAIVAHVSQLGELAIGEAVPELVRAIDTPLAATALIALARIADPAGRDVARRVLDDIRGPDEDRTWIYILPAQWLLAALGERALDVAVARTAIAKAYPRRYGYPTLDELASIRLAAGQLLLRAGTREDRESLLPWATATKRALREVGLAAHDALERPRPALRYFDPGRIAHLLETGGIAELRAALAAPDTVYRAHVATALANAKDAAAKDAALEWALDTIEAIPYRWIDDVADAGDRDVGIDEAEAIGVVRALEKSHAAKIARSPSRWVQAIVTREDLPLPVAEPVAAPGAPSWAIRRLDHSPFVFGKHINAIALDPSGTRLAVAGDGLGQIVDAATGEVLVRLTLRYSWGYDIAWHPSGDVLAIAYHGCHLVVFDAATGAERASLQGFGGVPDGIKACAFSPDGKFLAAGASDGSARIFAWPSGESVWRGTGPGGFQTLKWSPDGKTCTFSHVSTKRGQPNHLVTVDVATKRSKKQEMAASVWALLDHGEGRTFAGGAGPIVALDPKGKSTLKLMHKKVTRLAAAGPTAIVSAAETGELVHWDLTGKKPSRRDIASGNGPLWALAIGRDGTIYAAGTDGIVRRYHASGAPIESVRGHIHTAQARGFAPLADGSVVTSSWDGRVLRWPATFGSAALVAEFDSRAPEICGQPDRAHAYVGVPGGVLVVPMTGETQTIALGKKEDVEAIACDGDLLAVATDKDRVVAFRTGDLGEAWSAKVGDASSLCFRADGTLLVGDEGGRIGALDRSGNALWARREHRDLVDKLPHGNPHCTVFGLAASATSWVSASNDDSVRLFDGDARRRRFLVDGGIFNGIVFSPDGSRLAFAGSHEFSLFDATRGEHVLTIPVAQFPGADALTRPCFVDDRRVLVGAENGAIFEVAVT